jgi:hypothetical protein
MADSATAPARTRNSHSVDVGSHRSLRDWRSGRERERDAVIPLLASPAITTPRLLLPSESAGKAHWCRQERSRSSLLSSQASASTRQPDPCSRGYRWPRLRWPGSSATRIRRRRRVGGRAVRDARGASTWAARWRTIAMRSRRPGVPLELGAMGVGVAQIHLRHPRGPGIPGAQFPDGLDDDPRATGHARITRRGATRCADSPSAIVSLIHGCVDEQRTSHNPPKRGSS